MILKDETGAPIKAGNSVPTTTGYLAYGQNAKTYVGKTATAAALAAPGAPTVAAGAAGTPNGTYKVQVTFVTATGETTGGTEATVSVTNQQISWSAIPTGPAGTTARKLYRTAAGGTTGTEKLVTTLSDNTTTTYTDNVADGSLGAAVPTTNTSAPTTTVSLNTVTSGKTQLITDLFVYCDSTTQLDIRLQANAVDIFRGFCRDLAPIQAPAMETQPTASSGQSLTLLLPGSLSNVQNVSYVIQTLEQ